MKAFIRKLMWLAQRRRREAELREELEFHLEEEAEERKEQGLTSDEARWASRRDLGNMALVEENVRGVWIWRFWERLLQDVRYALRMLRKNPAFTLLATISLALGIGANTAIYSFMDSILLRSLPVSDPNSLVILQWHGPPRWQGGERRPSVRHSMSGTTYGDPKVGDIGGIFPYPAFELFRKNDALFSSVFAYHRAGELNVLVKGQADIAEGEYVSGDYFAGLNVPAAAGRMLFAGDDDAGSAAVAVISSKFSEKHFGSAANAAGQTMFVNNVPFTVAGVAPPEFFGVDPSAAPDIYLPIHASIAMDAADPFGGAGKRFLDQNDYWIEVMARLRPGVTREQAQAALAPQFHAWVESTASDEAERATLPALVVQEGAGGVEGLRRRYSQPLYMLIALTGLILAIACANIANLLLARATARKSEMALRLSLGAGRLRLVRQLLTESILLASLGGALGLLIVVWGIRFLTALLANGRSDFTLHATLNWHVLIVAAVLSFLTGVLFGLAPALESTRVNLVPALSKTRVGDVRSRRHPSLSQALLVSQIALSLVLLVAAGLFSRTLANLHSIDVGFNRDNVLLFDLNARKAGHKDPEILNFYGDLLKRFSTLPGVLHASLSHESLIDAGSGLPIYVPGSQPDEGTRYLCVGPDYLKTMQIPLLAGRDIEERDQPDAMKVAVVSELFAKTNFGGQSPIGRHIVLEYENHRRDMEIVGVARNAAYGGLKRKTPPTVYIPYNQGFPPPRRVAYELRTAGNPLSYANTVREIVHRADARVPVTDIRTEVVEIEQTINQEIVFAKLCTGFALLALVIACVGLYGTVSYNVARRTAEIGIRMALGAQPATVVWMILRQVLILAAVGLAISLPLTLATSKFVGAFLYNTKPNDPLTLALAILLLVGATSLAGYVPALKASRIDPMTALRHE